MGSRPQPDDVRSHLNAAIVVIMRLVIECDVECHEKSIAQGMPVLVNEKRKKLNDHLHMTDQRILALSFVLCTILFHLNHSPKDPITASGQALYGPCSLVEIAIASAGYATLYIVNFGEIILWPRGH